MSVSDCFMYHVLGSHVPLGFVICSVKVHFGRVQDALWALSFCRSTGPTY